MNVRVLLFPLCTAAVLATEACEGTTMESPSVRVCHDDTVPIIAHFPNGTVTVDTIIYRDDPRECRPLKRAA